MHKNPRLSIALDSDVLINLSKLHNNAEHCRLTMPKRIFSPLTKLSSLHRKGKLDFYVTPTVINEVFISENTMEYVARCCKAIRVDDDHVEEFAKRCDRLASEYVKKGAMDSRYFSHSHGFYPTNDAYIMAEASVCGLNLLTQNAKDFIFNDRFNSQHATRAEGIKQVNSAFGCYTNGGNSDCPSRPLSPEYFVEHISSKALDLSFECESDLFFVE